MRKTKRSSLHTMVGVVAAVCALGGVASGCGGDDSTGQGDGGTTAAGGSQPYELTVELNWLPGPDHIALLTALKEGYFEKEDLEVEYKPPPDSAAALKFVAADRVDLALSFGPDVLIAASQGLPVTAVGSIMPVPLASLVALPKTGIDSPADLAGKRVGNSGIPKENAMAEAIFEDAGIDGDDVTLVNAGFNLVPVALEGKVDALLGAFRTGTAVELAHRAKVEPVVIPVNEIGVPTYDELVVVANSNRLESDEEYQDGVRRFLAALERGAEAAIADPKAAEEVVLAAMDDLPSGEQELREEVQATLPLMTPPGGRKIGCFDAVEWDAFASWMEDEELLKGDVAVDSAVTNEYNEGC